MGLQGLLMLKGTQGVSGVVFVADLKVEVWLCSIAAVANVSNPLSTDHLIPWPYKVGLIIGIDGDEIAFVLNNHHPPVSLRPRVAEKDLAGLGGMDGCAGTCGYVDTLVGLSGILGELGDDGAPNRPKKRPWGTKRLAWPRHVPSPRSPIQPSESIPPWNPKTLAHREAIWILEAVAQGERPNRDPVALRDDG